MKKVLITGASGFVGKYLVPALIEKSYEIVCIGRGKAGPEFPQPVPYFQTDYSQLELEPILEGVDSIIHLAARRMTREDAQDDLDVFHQANVMNTYNLVKAAQKCDVRKLVFASTVAVYSAANTKPFTETQICNPINAYAMSKLVAEDYISMITRNSDLSATYLRFAALYGAGEKGTPALMKFVQQAINEETITLSGNPTYRIDQLYIKDAVSAILTALENHDAKGAYNIGAGQSFTIQDIAETINGVFDNMGNLNITAEDKAPLPETHMSIEHANTKLGWQPSYSLRDGLVDFKKMI